MESSSSAGTKADELRQRLTFALEQTRWHGHLDVSMPLDDDLGDFDHLRDENSQEWFGASWTVKLWHGEGPRSAFVVGCEATFLSLVQRRCCCPVGESVCGGVVTSITTYNNGHHGGYCSDHSGNERQPTQPHPEVVIDAMSSEIRSRPIVNSLTWQPPGNGRCGMWVVEFHRKWRQLGDERRIEHAMISDAKRVVEFVATGRWPDMGEEPLPC